MEQVGYKLLDANGNVLKEWGGILGQCPGKPDYIDLPNGDRVFCPELDTPYDGCVLTAWYM